MTQVTSTVSDPSIRAQHRAAVAASYDGQDVDDPDPESDDEH